MKNKTYWEGFHWRLIDSHIIDGDTIHGSAILSPKLTLQVSLRFGRINAPEVKGSEKVQGLVSKAALEGLLEGVEEVLIWSTKLDTFGSRYVAELYIQQNDKLVNINDWLVENGFAVCAKRRDLNNPIGWVVKF